MKNVTVKNAAAKTLADQPYIIDFVAHKVLVSSKYMKDAGEFGSDAFNKIMEIKSTLPDSCPGEKEAQNLRLCQSVHQSNEAVYRPDS